MIKWLCGWPHPVICEHKVGAGAGRPEGVGEGHSRAGKTGKVLDPECTMGEVGLGSGRVWEHLLLWEARGALRRGCP